MSRVKVKEQNKHAMQRLEERAGLTERDFLESASKKGLDPEYFKDSYYDLYKYLHDVNPRKRVKLYKGFVCIFNKTSDGCITMYPLKDRFKERYEFLLKEETSYEDTPVYEEYPIVTVTGHRPGRLGCNMKYNEDYLLECEDLFDWFKCEFLNHNIKEVYCGLASGTDMIAAMAVIDLKHENIDIKLNCVAPFTDYNSDDYYYNYVKENSDSFTTLYTYQNKNAYTDRNFYMINRSNIVFAVFDGVNNGGTADTIYYADNYNINVNYYPEQFVKRSEVQEYYASQYTEEDIEL